ncbi:MAG: glutamine--fructose-6-phosphate transaminase (isomerizing) [Desulfohalobiaceae bacterium]|nr:glutamine--fructose-6-phosphate transaminase (isomerizing) [Desulfohalobiaceae bacterium]
MCGIIGYAGHRPAVTVILEGLKRLEYRGYDSAGMALIQNKELNVVRAKGKIRELEDKLAFQDPYHATTGIGHTRWATHGLPSEENAHPHPDQEQKLALVHNGIIENHARLKRELQQLGCSFRSETDTEVLSHLISQELKQQGSVPRAMSTALQRVEGSYAVALISLNGEGRIWAARHSSPLILGLGQGENFVASDIPAFLPYTREVVFLEDNEIVQITPSSWQVLDGSSLEHRDKEQVHISWDVQSAQKSGYRHFMLKEIMEQPRVIRDCLAGRTDSSRATTLLPELDHLPLPRRLHIVACGTSYHAGLWARNIFQDWAGIPVEVEIASEFRYNRRIIQEGDLILAVSQSGETADTLAGLRQARQLGHRVLGLCNVLGSSIAREADGVVYTQAGPEISVASTKAMCSQMTAMLLLALHWGRMGGFLDEPARRGILRELEELPAILEAELEGMQQTAQRLARKYAWCRSCFFLGRGDHFALALEGALKLKEISYIHAEGYAAGEMKHGPIALVDPEFPTFALAPGNALQSKLLSNLQEVRTRGGPVVCLAPPGLDQDVDDIWEIPAIQAPLNGFLFLSAMQLFAYEMAVYLGKDVDQPRNLAKSVTVE